MNRILLFILLFGLSFFDKRNALSKESKIYVRTNAYIGYNYSALNDYVDTDSFISSKKNINKISTSERRHLPVIGIGSNLYFKFSEKIHPFIGFDLTGMIPVGEKTEIAKSFEHTTSMDSKTYNTSFSFEKYLKLNAKFGTKFNFNNNFAIEPYALAGMEVVRTNFRFSDDDSLYSRQLSNKLLAIYGFGINFVFKDRYDIGVEYYTYNNTTKNFTVGNIAIKHKISMYNLLVKFGIQF